MYNWILGQLKICLYFGSRNSVFYTQKPMMPNHQVENPVTRSLHNLAQQWQTFEQEEEAVLGIWRVSPEQSRMIDALVYMEDTEYGVIPSMFLPFESAFIDSETYAYELIKEFLTHASQPESRASLEAGGIDIDRLRVDEIKDTRAWLALLSDFTKLTDALTGYFVAYLLPDQVKDQHAWLAWIERLLQMPIPDKIRFMLKEDERQPVFENLLQDYPKRIKLLVPDLDMGEVMKQILEEAAQGREDDPGMLFRKAMLDLGQAAGKKQIVEAEKAAETAFSIAREAQWPHLQIATLFTLGNAYIGVKDFEKAIVQYRRAQEVAAQYEAEAPEMAGQLRVQAIMGEAGCHLGKQDFEVGAKVYARAGEPARNIGKPHLELEAWRMAAFCNQYQKDYRQAWYYYREAWEAGKKMDASMRLTSTMPYVGQAMLDIHPNADTNIRPYELEDEINALLGENWQKLIKTA